MLTLNNNQDIYPPELLLKKTTECATALSYLDVLINGRYSTAVFDKRDSFTFNIVNFPRLSSNIPSKPAYGVYISQLVRIGRICSNVVQFKLRHYTLTQKTHEARILAGLCMAIRKFASSHVGIITK